MLWAEGPAWNGVGRYLLWSDIPNNVQLRRLDDDGRVSAFRNPAGNSNGNTFDFEGRQISCEHGNRRVVRYEHTSGITVLADKSLPYDVLKKVMATCTDADYGKISLAVIQKEKPVPAGFKPV